jgi:hypothetical protein
MLSEQAIANAWRRLFKGGDITSETITSAEEIIDQLPLESPLRVRFDNELCELRDVAARKKEAADSGR